MPKLKKFLKCDFENITPLQFWAIMIKYYQNNEIREKLLETSKYKEDSAMAEKVASLITDDMRAWAIRLSRKGGEMDRLARLKIARREGSHANAIETARRMIARNYNLDDIADITMLPISEIQQLK